MNSRRSIGFPHAEGYAGQVEEYHIRSLLGWPRSDVRFRNVPAVIAGNGEFSPAVGAG